MLQQQSEIKTKEMKLMLSCIICTFTPIVCYLVKKTTYQSMQKIPVLRPWVDKKSVNDFKNIGNFTIGKEQKIFRTSKSQPVICNLWHMQYC